MSYNKDPNSYRESLDSYNSFNSGHSEALYSYDNMGYYNPDEREKRYRDPEADNKYVDSKTSNNGNEVIAHNKGRIDPNEPSSRDAEAYHHKSHKRRSSKHKKEHKKGYHP